MKTVKRIIAVVLLILIVALIGYLVFMPEYGVDVGNYAKPVKTWLCMGIPCKVTHWMPLPEPPERST